MAGPLWGLLTKDKTTHPKYWELLSVATTSGGAVIGPSQVLLSLRPFSYMEQTSQCQGAALCKAFVWQPQSSIHVSREGRGNHCHLLATLEWPKHLA